MIRELFSKFGGNKEGRQCLYFPPPFRILPMENLSASLCTITSCYCYLPLVCCFVVKLDRAWILNKPDGGYVSSLLPEEYTRLNLPTLTESIRSKLSYILPLIILQYNQNIIILRVNNSYLSFSTI